MNFHAEKLEDAGATVGPRARIREALLDLCFERGLDNVTVAELCRRAGVGRSVFERHYTDLEECFFEVYRTELEGFRRRAAAAREEASDWPGRLRATAYALYRYLADDVRVRRLTVVDVRGGGERVQLLFAEEFEALIDLIDEGRREPGAPGSLTRATAEQVGGGIFGRIYLAGRTAGPMPAEEEIVPQMMYAAMLPYLGAGGAARELEILPPPSGPEEAPPPPGADRARIREALLDLCHERGYRDLDLADVLSRAGVEEAGFRRHFADLEDCLCVVFAEIRDGFFADLERRLAGRRGWRERLRIAAYALAHLLGSDERITHLIVVDVHAAGERARLLVEAVNRRLFDLIDEGRAEGPDPGAVSRATAESIGGAIFLRLYTAVGRGERPGAEMIPSLMYAAVLPYLGPVAAQEELHIPPPPAADV